MSENQDTELEGMVWPEPNEFILKIFSALGTIDKRPDQHLLIIIAQNFAQRMIRALIKEHCRPEWLDLKSHGAFLLILREKAIISEEDFQIFYWLMERRNDAAHTCLFEITETHVKLLGEKLSARNPFKSVQDTELMIPLFISHFWIKHAELFNKKSSSPLSARFQNWQECLLNSC